MLDYLRCVVRAGSTAGCDGLTASPQEKSGSWKLYWSLPFFYDGARGLLSNFKPVLSGRAPVYEESFHGALCENNWREWITFSCLTLEFKEA